MGIKMEEIGLGSAHLMFDNFIGLLVVDRIIQLIGFGRCGKIGFQLQVHQEPVAHNLLFLVVAMEGIKFHLFNYNLAHNQMLLVRV